MEKKTQEENFIISIIDSYVKEISDNWKSIFSIGFLMVIFGVVFLVWPEKAIVFIAYLIGVMAIIAGFWILSLAFRVKNIENKYKKIKDGLKSKFFD